MLNKLLAPFAIALINRDLLVQLIKRDIGEKYKGTLLGLIWAFINPLLMLAIYTVVFKFIFKARWPDTTDSTTEFALMLFIGLIIHGAAAEVISRAATSISANKSYVKKVVFPLHILSWSLVVSATTHFLFGLLILVIICIFWGKPIHATGFLLPVVIIPFLLFLLAFSWILSALSVYFKDITQIAPSLIMVLLFTSTVFFPLNNAPELVQPILAFNPLTLIIESSRDVLFYGKYPDVLALIFYFFFSFLACIFAYYFFSRLAKGFADTL
jgi:lipopolysaccharide transport system permease protein